MATVLPLTIAEKSRHVGQVRAGIALAIAGRMRAHGKCTDADLMRDGFRPVEIMLWADEARKKIEDQP